MKPILTRTSLAIVGFWILSTTSLLAEDFTAEQLEYFERHVRPVLVNHCYQCHSGQAKELQAGLRLDSREALLRGGDSGPAISVGKADESLLIEAVRYQSFEMPPRGKLPASVIQHLVEWVNLDAPWPQQDESTPDQAVNSPEQPFDWRQRLQQQWAFQPLTNTPPPRPQSGWAFRELDQFIIQRLDEAGLQPAPDAPPRALVRRLYMDLIGLPPTPREFAEFCEDASATSYHRLVDRLLDSPRFGEKWARHWLDLVRYAETYGHEYDYPIAHAYQYRDYLIRALNGDVSYRQLLREHLAGDLLQPPRLRADTQTNESIIGTSFWLLGEANHGPTDVAEDEATRIDNQIDVFSKAFLGLSVACARCHDHKFDPISTEDYYALKGVLQSSRYQIAELMPEADRTAHVAASRQWHEQANRLIYQAVTQSQLNAEDVARFLLERYQHAADVPGDGSPLDLWRAVQRQTHASLANADSPARTADESSFPAILAKVLDRFANEAASAESRQNSVQVVTPIIVETLDRPADGDGLTRHRIRPTDACRHGRRAGVIGRVGFAAGHLEPYVGETIQSRTFQLKNGFIHLHLRAKNATARLICHNYQLEPHNGLLFGNTRLSGDALGDGKSFRWVRLGNELRAGDHAYLEFSVARDGFLVCDMTYLDEADVDTPASHPYPAPVGAFVDPVPQSLEELAQRYGLYWLQTQQAWRAGNANAFQAQFVDWLFSQGLLEPSADWAHLLRQMDVATQSLPTPLEVLALRDGSGRDAQVAIRGNVHNLAAEVPRRLPLAVGGEHQSPIEFGSGRMELAHRLLDSPRPHPLVARVVVNRIWAHLFGQGIVPSVDDFGAMGQSPSHPELLDWVAIDFTQHGWSLKRLIRQIVTSHTYRMSTRPRDPGARHTDPQNRLLFCMPVRRLSSEQLRDQILAVAGTLNTEMGGPSVPVYLTAFMQGRGRPEPGPLDGAGRRSIYLSVRRNFLPQDSLAFDFPLPTTTVGRRVTSNVPAQSLMLLNSPFVAEQAHHWARRLIQEHPGTETRLRSLFLTALARPPTARELSQCHSFLTSQAQQYQQHRLSPGNTAVSAIAASPDRAADDNRAKQTSADDIRAWTDLCHVMFNLKEFLYLP